MCLRYLVGVVTVNLHQRGQLNYNLEFPSEWNELYPAEVLEISKQLLINSDNQPEARAQILKFIFQSRKPGFTAELLDPEQIVLNGYPLLDFVYEANTLTTPAEKMITLPGIPRFFRPQLELQDVDELTCGEYEDAQLSFNKFFDEPGADSLASLAAILYREKGTEYIKYDYKTATYTTYNSVMLQKAFLKLAPERLYAVFIWYAGCQNQLPAIFPTVYDRNAGTSGDGSKDRLAFTKCIHAGAGVKNGTRQQIRMMKLYEFLFDMEQEAVKAKQLQEEYEKQN